MTTLGWVLTAVLFSIYLVCVVTVCMVTFRKGYLVLGIVGIAFPLLWLLGAVLPAKPGSAQAAQEALRREHQAEQGTPERSSPGRPLPPAARHAGEPARGGAAGDSLPQREAGPCPGAGRV